MTAKWLTNLTPALSNPSSAPNETDKSDRTVAPAKATRGARALHQRMPTPRDAKRVQSFVQRGRGR